MTLFLSQLTGHHPIDKSCAVSTLIINILFAGKKKKNILLVSQSVIFRLTRI